MKNKYKINQFKKRLILTIFGSKIFSFPIIYKLRILFYRKEFNISKNPTIENNVWIQSTHGFKGKIKIGKNVLLAKNTTIDYSGKILIKDNVWISEDTNIYTHIHKLDSYRTKRNKNNIIPTSLIIENNCWIGAKSIILPEVRRIGENSIVAAGSVVTKEVPRKVLVGGNPAKIIKKI